ncbi:MAG: FG-GAP repeat domain-containing protein [Bdellovibrionales bacterium]
MHKLTSARVTISLLVGTSLIFIGCAEGLPDGATIAKSSVSTGITMPSPLKPGNCRRMSDGLRCDVVRDGAVVSTTMIDNFSDALGWNAPEHTETFRYGDIDGDGADDVCARGNAGMICYFWRTDRFDGPYDSMLLSDSNGWTQPQYYKTIGLADVDGDGRVDLCARAEAGILCWPSTGTGFRSTAYVGPSLSDTNGWDNPMYYESIRYGDRNNDGRADVCSLQSDGYRHCWLFNGTAFASSSVLESNLN